MLASFPIKGGRAYTYEPANDPDLPWDGILEIARWIGGPDHRAWSDRYAVRELPPASGSGYSPGRRTFLVCREALAGDVGSAAARAAAERGDFVHRCTVGPGVRHCTCPDAGTGRVCGHLLAIEDGLDHGGFPDPAGEDPRGVGDDFGDAQAGEPDVAEDRDSDPTGDDPAPWFPDDQPFEPEPHPEPACGSPLAAGDLGGGLSYEYAPAPDRGQPWDGVLTIARASGTRTPRTVTDRYGIEEQPPEGFPGRVFLLCKETHAGDLATAAGRRSAERCGEVYRCSIGQHVLACTCPGSVAGGRVCKHLLALAGCVGHGAFPDPLTAGRRAGGWRPAGGPRERR